MIQIRESPSIYIYIYILIPEWSLLRRLGGLLTLAFSKSILRLFQRSITEDLGRRHLKTLGCLIDLSDWLAFPWGFCFGGLFFGWFLIPGWLWCYFEKKHMWHFTNLVPCRAVWLKPRILRSIHTAKTACSAVGHSSWAEEYTARQRRASSISLLFEGLD